MQKIVLTFEAKSIQTYLLDSSKLKDMIGASEQIENLCADHGLLDKILKTLGLKPVFSRRAGGAFTVFFNHADEADRFYALWSYCVQQQVPGLVFVLHQQAYAQDKDIKTALNEQQRALEHVRSQLYSQLPVPGPLVARAKRTGGAAVAYQHGEKQDAPTLCKRKFESRALLDKVDPNKQFEWPDTFDRDDEEDGKQETVLFPVLRDNSYIGVIHADGNGLGKIVKKLIENTVPEKLQTTLLAFSDAVRDATLTATHTAICEVATKHAVNSGTVMPARPLVVGGDDWSFIVRGDLAVDFTAAYLEAFATETRTAFAQLKKEYPDIELPDYLTACAGIAFVKPKQPFHQAYALAESLCKYAKKRAKADDDKTQTPSALAFHRITTSQIDDFEMILERELTTAQNIVLSMQPYFINLPAAIAEAPRLSDLINLANSLKNPRLSRGATRELLDLLHMDLSQAQQRFERWQENLQLDEAGKKLKQEIMDDLYQLTGESRHLDLLDLLKKIPKTNLHESPLGDALTLNSIRRGSEHDD